MNQDRKNLSNNKKGTPMNQNQENKNTETPTGLTSHNPKQDRPQRKPTGSFSDSFKSGIKNRALDKADNVIPGFNTARNLKSKLDNMRESNKKESDALNNIRAKQGPQLPPKRESRKSEDSSPENIEDTNKPKGPSFLPKAPSFLEDDNDTLEEVENPEENNLSMLQSIFGTGKKKGKGPARFLIEGSLGLKKLLLPIIIVVVLLLFCIMIISVIVAGDKNTPIAIADGNDEYKLTKEQKAFKERLDEVHDEYMEDGKDFDEKMIGAVFIILNTYGEKYDYDDMTKGKIKEIVDLMFDSDGNYSEDTFKSNLKSYFQSKIPGKDDAIYDRYVEEVFSSLEEYKEQTGGNNLASTGQTGSMCTYTFKGMNLEQYGSNSNNKAMTISNLMVRLMSVGDMCDGRTGQVLDDGELIPFEKYVLGVAYAEIGPSASPEAFKTQMIVARSYALTQAAASGNALSRKLVQENGQWILQINNCVTDQVYCDPDKGCSRNTECKNQNGVMHVGEHTAANRCSGPIAQDSPLRQYANEVAGKIPLDSQGRIYLTNFQQTEQNLMESYAKQGLDYTQIIMKIFPKVVSISESNCTEGEDSSSNYRTWKQTDSKWANVKMAGNTTIREAGCLATSIAMLIEKSGAKTTIQGEFNPGTFVEAMKKVNGFDSRANLVWSSVEKIASTFKYQESMKTDLSNMTTKDEKVKAIKENVEKNNTYCVVAVNNDGHWVAIDKVENNSIKMLDPGSKATDLFKEYDWSTTTRLECFKVG